MLQVAGDHVDGLRMQTGQGRTEELSSPVRPGPALIPAPRRSFEFGASRSDSGGPGRGELGRGEQSRDEQAWDELAWDEPDIDTYSLDEPPPTSAVTPRIVQVVRWIRSGRVAVVTLLITAVAAAGVAAVGTHAVDTHRQRQVQASAPPAPAAWVTGQDADAPTVNGTVEVSNDGPLPIRISGMRVAVPGVSLGGPQIPGVVQAGRTVRIAVVVSIRCGVRLHKGPVPITVSVRQPRGQDRDLTAPLQVAAGAWSDLRTRSCATSSGA